MATKKYALTRMHSLVTSFKTPSGIKIIAFDGGSRYHERKGYFMTSDKELQEAIEKSASFNREYKLVETIEEPKEATPIVEVVDYKSLLVNPAEATEEPSVTTIQKAKMWLQATYGKSFKGTTKDEIQKEAAQMYNTTFPNW